jgi:hypothetical protein
VKGISPLQIQRVPDDDFLGAFSRLMNVQHDTSSVVHSVGNVMLRNVKKHENSPIGRHN